jgi:hypothetical protein
VDKQLFATRLRDTGIAARDFAKQFVDEPLPDDIRYRIRLNSSYDGNPRVGDEVVYPEDSSYARADAVKECGAEHVVDMLWRDGRVPEWIDACVISETGSTTVIQLMCCGRFTGNEQQLYHQQEGRPPFHMTGPALPPRYEDGQRFSIHLRSECWTRGDIERLRSHAPKVWSLELMGYAMDDHALSELPDLPRMEILELNFSALHGVGLVDLARHEKLRILRLRLDRYDDFFVPKLPTMRSVELVDLANLPSRPWGSEQLLRAFPRLASVTLQTRGDLHVGGKCPSQLSDLSVTAECVRGSLLPQARMGSLSLHASRMAESEVKEWLAGVKHVGALHLRGTPLSDAFAEELPAKYGLSYLDIVDTGVSESAVGRIAAAHPSLKLHPNLKAGAR